MSVFFLVFSRDDKNLNEKIAELDSMDYPYLIICGKKINHKHVVYREPRGKYDAINFGFGLVPEETEIVVLNDADTIIHNFNAALTRLRQTKATLVFTKVVVKEGPQRFFYRMLDGIRRTIPICASGELMLINREILGRILPLKPCKAEDSYILFRVLRLKKIALFCEDCTLETERTKTLENEEAYKRKTVCGLYQALGYAKLLNAVSLFFWLLPLATPLLLVLGKRGQIWMKGILLGLADYLKGDRVGTWQPVYMD